MWTLEVQTSGNYALPEAVTSQAILFIANILLSFNSSVNIKQKHEAATIIISYHQSFLLSLSFTSSYLESTHCYQPQNYFVAFLNQPFDSYG